MTSANESNYTKGRSQKIQYIVLHYTAGNGDSADGNINYFKNHIVMASAHYFVDKSGWKQSVDDNDTAWAVGTAGVYSQKHPRCMNSNSISIEMCCLTDRYTIPEQTVKNAAELTRRLMKKYNVPVENVLRHFDVVNKKCPASWVDHPEKWAEFKQMLGKDWIDMTKEELLSTSGTGDKPSAWAKTATEWAKKEGIFAGDGKGNYGWQQPITREAVAQILYNAIGKK